MDGRAPSGRGGAARLRAVPRWQRSPAVQELRQELHEPRVADGLTGPGRVLSLMTPYAGRGAPTATRSLADSRYLQSTIVITLGRIVCSYNPAGYRVRVRGTTRLRQDCGLAAAMRMKRMVCGPVTDGIWTGYNKLQGYHHMPHEEQTIVGHWSFNDRQTSLSKRAA